MSGGYKGSNGHGTTDGGGTAGVIGRMRRIQRDERAVPTEGTALYQEATATVTAMSAGNVVPYPITFDVPFADLDYMVTAQCTGTDGYTPSNAVTTVGAKTTTGVTVAVRALGTVNAGNVITVRAMHL